MAGQSGQRGRDPETYKRKRDPGEHDKRPHTKRPRSKAKDASTKNSKTRSSGVETGVLVQAVTKNGSQELSRTKINRKSAGDAVGWNVSSPMGGRMADIDPIFVDDEKYLIVTYNTSIQVYSVEDSLLVRRIPVPSRNLVKPAAFTIVATCRSQRTPGFVWIACSDGSIWKIDWTDGSVSTDGFRTPSKTALDMTVAVMDLGDGGVDVVFVTEKTKGNGNEIVAYCRYEGSSQLLSKSLFSAKQAVDTIHLLRSGLGGRVLVGATPQALLVGLLRDGANTIEELRYDVYRFDTSDFICSLDLRFSPRDPSQTTTPKRPSAKASFEALDLIAGGARGAIYYYNDIIHKLQSLGGKTLDGEQIEARKYHWHRRAVHSLKWSRDGHYMISGGSENALVLWQVDTAKRDFLPHLSGVVENIVVSPSGSSYAVHLDDNSMMVLSTAEMKPTTYVSGIQSAARNSLPSKDLIVARVWSAPAEIQVPSPAAMNPTDPSKLHVCVGSGRQSAVAGETPSAPLLQTFDLESFRSVSKQPLARAQPTDVNITATGHPISEPRITHIAFSNDGKWLATVDDWQPPRRDVAKVLDNDRDRLIQERREIFLKFWTVSSDDEPMALVSRINSPHVTNRPETVLALVADRSSARFATLGDDGMARIWQSRLRQQDGVATVDSAGQTLQSWSCVTAVALGNGTRADALFVPGSAGESRNGSLAFSEDGSTLFAAFGGGGDGSVYVIDTASGEVRCTLDNLWSGSMRHLRVLSPYVITLSDDLRVYDVVADELRYGIQLPIADNLASFAHLAVDYKSRSFAVVVPRPAASYVAVFSPEVPEPLLADEIHHRITSLISPGNSPGFVAIDDAAQLWSIAVASDPAAVYLSRPLEDMHLEQILAEEEPPANNVIMLAEDDEEMASGDEEKDLDDADMDDDDDSHPAVVSRQQLAELFDATPAFAMLSIEDMFNKVTGLLATKPLSHATA